VTRTARRLTGILVGVGFSAAPLTMVACTLMSAGAAVTSVTYGIGFRIMIDGAIAHASGRIALGALLVAVLFSLSWLLAIINGAEGSMLTDRVNLVLGVRVARLAATLPTLEHFEHSEPLGRLEQLTSNRRTLAGAPRQLVGLFGQTLRAIGIVVLLARRSRTSCGSSSAWARASASGTCRESGRSRRSARRSPERTPMGSRASCPMACRPARASR
jgi:ATP-binding cassette subfamily B protein